MELASGIIFAFLYWHYGFSAELGIMAFYACLFLLIFVIDLEHELILNKIVYPGMVIALLIACFAPPSLYQWPFSGIANFALAGGIGFIIFLLIAIISRGGMGWGDVKLVALIGLATGFPLVLVSIIIGAVLGGAVAITLLASKKKSRKEAIPFGPFLSLAALITLLWGNNILYCYLGL